MTKTSVCIIIPAYNEAKRLQLGIFRTFAQENNRMHLLFVNDGSSDATQTELENFCKPFQNISVFNCIKNEGKAEAVRLGMQHAIETIQSDYYAFIDADLSTPLEELFLLKNEMDKNPKLLMAFGSRILKIGSNINRKSYRHYLGRIIATCISIQVGLSIYDTQCGAKMFRAEIVSYLFQQQFISRWLFDVELFNRMLRKFTKEEVLQKIKEIPLTTWTDIDGSKLGFIDILKTPIDLLKIATHYKNNRKVE